MTSFSESVNEYKKQLAQGYIKKAYQGLMKYVMDLRSYFKNKYPEYSVPSSIYYGYMDMTYFPIFPESLKSRQLKIALVLIHETVSFEVWLAAYNRRVQAQYWELFKESNWNKYRIPASIKGADSIVECTLADTPDFNNLDVITRQIETGTLQFIADIEDFLAQH